MEGPLAKFRIATPRGASFTTAGDYGYELEALTPIDAEIFEVPAGSEDEFVSAARDADALYAKGHPGHQLPGHLHRRGRRSCDDVDPGHLPPADRAGQAGARRALVRGPADAVEDPAADGPDPGPGVVRPCRASGCQTGQALWAAHHRLRPVHRGAGGDRTWGRAGEPPRIIAARRHHLDARP